MKKSSKTLVVTGASGVVGRQLVRYFLRRGHHVIATSRQSAKLRELAVESEGAPGMLTGIEVELLAGQLQSFVENLYNEDLAPHYLVNSARSTGNLSFELTGRPSRSQWIAEFELGVMVPAELTMLLASANKSRLEAVVNVASMYGVVAVNPHLYDDPEKGAPIHYGVTKAALLHLTKELAVRMAPKGVRVNAVSYGGIEGRTDHAFRTRYAALCPMSRMLRADEVAPMVEFLLLEGAGVVTGHNLVADGGWTLW